MTRLYVMLALLLGVLLVVPAFFGDYALGIFYWIFFYAYLGQSWNILTGYTGHISLGHALYVGTGAFTSAYLFQTYGISPWLGMLIGGCIAVAISQVIGFLGFRFGLRGVYFVILTIAFAEITRLLVSHTEALGGFEGMFLDLKPGFVNFQFQTEIVYYYVALAFMVASIVVVRLMEVSRLGRFMVAVREDEEAAEALGVNPFKYSMISIAISAFMTSLAGALYAFKVFYIHPNGIMGMGFSIELILRPIVGGIGTVLGPAVGSFILTPLSETMRAYFAKGGLEGLHLVLYGILAILVVLFMRQGVVAYLKKVVSPWLRLEK